MIHNEFLRRKSTKSIYCTVASKLFNSEQYIFQIALKSVSRERELDLSDSQAQAVY